MPTRNVVLTDHHEALIADLVASGRYQNASEVLRDGLRMIEERNAREAAHLKALREAAQLGIADLETGDYKAFASFEDMEAYLTEMTDKIIANGAI